MLSKILTEKGKVMKKKKLKLEIKEVTPASQVVGSGPCGPQTCTPADPDQCRPTHGW